MSELLTFLLSHEDQFRRARLASLYSDFQLQHATNPDGYYANATAWETGLAHAVEAGMVPGGRDIFSLRTGSELLRALETKEWGRPLALGTVINEAIYSGRMIPLEGFLKSPTSIYNRNWTLHPRRLLSWSLKQLGLGVKLLKRTNLQEGQYVIISNVEQASEKAVSGLGSRDTRIDRIIPMNAFRERVRELLCLDNGLTDRDLSTLLTYLSRDRMQIVYNDQLVKLRGPGKDAMSISSEDTAIASLKSLIIDLNVRLSQLSSEITVFSEKARVAVMQKNRAGALANLQSRKLREGLYKSRFETLSQLEGIHNQIEEAADQVEVVRVMKASANVLRALNVEVGSLEKIEDIMEDLREEMNKADDIKNAIGEGGQGTGSIDDRVINEELDFLEKEEQKKSEERDAQKVRRKLDSINNISLPGTLHTQETSSKNTDTIIDKDSSANTASLSTYDNVVPEAQYP